MSFSETFKLAGEFRDKLEKYSTVRLDSSFYGAMNVLSDLLNKSESDAVLKSKLNKWLKSGSTLDLKEIVKSDNLNDFNVMCYLDTVATINK